MTYRWRTVALSPIPELGRVRIVSVSGQPSVRALSCTQHGLFCQCKQPQWHFQSCNTESGSWTVLRPGCLTVTENRWEAYELFERNFNDIVPFCLFVFGHYGDSDDRCGMILLILCHCHLECFKSMFLMFTFLRHQDLLLTSIRYVRNGNVFLLLLIL